MTLKAYRTHFYKELEAFYPQEEYETFFKVLAQEYLKLAAYEIPLNFQLELDEAQRNLFDKALSRLKQNEPLQYLVASTEFYGFPFILISPLGILGSIAFNLVPSPPDKKTICI